MNTMYDVEDAAGLISKRAGIVITALVLFADASLNRAVPQFWVWFCAVVAGVATWAIVSTLYTPYLLRKYFPPPPKQEVTMTPPRLEASAIALQNGPARERANGRPVQIRPIADVNPAEIVQRVLARQGETGNVRWPGLLQYAEAKGRGRIDEGDLDQFADNGEALLRLLIDLGAIVVLSIAGGISAYSLSSQAVTVLKAVVDGDVDADQEESYDFLGAVLG